MLYHVIRRPPNNNTNISNQFTNNEKNNSLLIYMPRYHYSRVAPHSATTSSESFFQRQNFNGPSSKPLIATATTTSNNNNNTNHTSNSYFSSGLFKSTFTPLVTHSRTMMPNKREFTQISIIREDEASATNSSIHSIPVNFISEMTQIPSNINDSTRNSSPKPHYTNPLRPGSKYSVNHANTNVEESEKSETNIPRLPSVSRRLNLTVPVMTATTAPATSTTDDDNDDITKQNILPPSTRRIPIRFAQTPNAASIPTNSARISSAILRSSPLSHPLNNQLQRQKTDLADAALSSDLASTGSNTSSARRAEAMAREAIQGVVRFQQQQQQSNSLLSDNNNSILIRSPAISRRVIVNLKNNQSVSLDSRLLSAHSMSTKPLSNPSSSRMSQRNNIYHIPVLHEIQLPSHPISIVADNLIHSSQSPSIRNSNNSSYKNEFRMEMPVSTITKDDQENLTQLNNGREEEGITNYDSKPTIIKERIPSSSSNSNQTLKSILKRSSPRETVSRKNVSFMNA